MSNWIIVILCAVAAVALFVAGMSLTLMLKGHHIDSEISTNKEMQRRDCTCRKASKHASAPASP